MTAIDLLLWSLAVGVASIMLTLVAIFVYVAAKIMKTTNVKNHDHPAYGNVVNIDKKKK